MKLHKAIARQISQTVPKEKKELFLILMFLASDSILVDEQTPHYLDQLTLKYEGIHYLGAELYPSEPISE